MVLPSHVFQQTSLSKQNHIGEETVLLPFLRDQMATRSMLSIKILLLLIVSQDLVFLYVLSEG